MDKKLSIRIALTLGICILCAYFAFPLNKRISLGLDLQGGMHLLMKVDTSKLSEKAKIDAADRAIEVIRNRIDQFGVRETSIQKQGNDEIVIQLPGVTDRDRALEVIGKTAQLEFKLVERDSDKMKAALEGNVPEGYELRYTQEDREPILLESKAVLSGDSLTDAQVTFSQSGFGEPVVSIRFNADGAKKFAEITAANVGRRLAIVLDGKVQSAPNIKEAIPSGEAVITGRFNPQQAADLALILRVGALPAPMSIEEERTIGPLLGQDSINKGIKAIIFGGLFVILFMATYYLIAGIISDIALLMNLLMIIGGMGLLPLLFPGISATLTLPGIAGMVLSLGMAVDANVLINERIREELTAGRNLRTAIDNGYSRAFSAILDSHMTNLIAAFLMFQFGTGPIRGFAVTLTIGLVSSLFTSVVVTHAMFDIMLKKGWLKDKLPMLHILGNTKLDFIGKRKIFYALSIILISVSIGAYIWNVKNKTAYGIDFAGGQLQEYRFKTPAPMEKLRADVKAIGIADASIQQFSNDPRVVLIRTTEDKSKILTEKLISTFPDQDVQVLRIERVGPVAGKQLQSKAIYAILWSLVGILIYIAFRFKHFTFALAGIIGLLHDVVVGLGLLMVMNWQIDLLSITAFLTIAGYSISDTIIIYDRVRENTRLYGNKMGLAELINLSVNQTLGRTILTTTTTLLTVIAILVYGGPVLKSFSACLFIGFLSGVYSTVYIASPLVLAWSKKTKK